MRILALVLLAASVAHAQDLHVAVAANFASPARLLADRFVQAGGSRAELSAGSTGKFYAQIKAGAPFDVLLSADEETPSRLEKEGAAVQDTRFTYAVGTLVLWSARPGLVDANGDVLRGDAFRRLAIANPRLAPYGKAAQETLEKLGQWQRLQSRLVLGENVAQAYQFVQSGNADLGFVALSQVVERPAGGVSPRVWTVPGSLHAPLRQDAVLLAHGRDNAAARSFLAFLRTAAAKDLIRSYGYGLP